MEARDLDVKRTIESLVRLQEHEQTMASLVARLAEIPSRLQSITASLAAAEQGVARARRELEGGSKERRTLEQDVDVIKQKVDRYQTQLYEVKTNEQYRALNKEIATERTRIDHIEEKILLNLERADELSRSLKQEEARLGTERERVSAETRALEEDKRRDEAEVERLAKEIRILQGTIDEGALGLYRRIADTRAGIGVSRVDGENCGECRVRARPQRLLEVRSFTSLVQCESCQRILFGGPAADPAATEPGGSQEC